MITVNTKLFSEVPKEGYPREGSYEYHTWWDEQYKRCMYGHTIGGLRITGIHYFYLNFWRINRKVEDRGYTSSDFTYPDFTDIDWFFYTEFEKCFEAKIGIIAGKARRKGFSYKNSCILAWFLFFVKNSSTAVGAYLDEYSTNGTMAMVKAGINALFSEGCEFCKNLVVNDDDYLHTGYKEKINGQTIIRGFNSQCKSITFFNNPRASVGKAVNCYIWEEAGVWKNLLKSYAFSKDTWMVGGEAVGIPVIYGSSGVMGAESDDFEHIFYNPTAYGLKAYPNEFSEKSPDLMVGMFFPDHLYYPPYMDEKGNSLREEAKAAVLKKRDSLRLMKSEDFYIHVTQHPITPEELFLISAESPFNREKLLDQQAFCELEANKGLVKRGELEWKDDKWKEVVFIEKSTGHFQIVEHPREDCIGLMKEGQKIYIAGLDPYEQDQAEYGSAGAMFIFKRMVNAEQTYNIPVAQYTDRPMREDDFYENCLKLQVYYGHAKMLVENNCRSWYHWYRQNRKFEYLVPQPNDLIKTIIPTSMVSRPFGIHMTKEIKEDLVRRTKDYINDYSEHIYFIDLLEELIRFNFDGNFDRVMAFGMCLFHNLSIQMSAKRRDSEDGRGIVLTAFRVINGVTKRVELIQPKKEF